MRTNVQAVNTRRTHEGAPASAINAEQELRRSLMACMLWESTFYEDGVDVAERIVSLVPKVNPPAVAAMAVEAREKMHLRHAPLWLVRAMVASDAHRPYVRKTLARVIQRADEMGEFLSLLWGGKEGKLPASVKKGLADAFGRFDAYRLAKYNRDTAITLRDVLFMCHAKPKDDAQAALWKQLVDDTLPAPDTWEVALSAGKDKKLTWERLISENKLGGLAMLRNLRNMQEAGVEAQWIRAGLQQMNASRVLPFRFIAAARYAPQHEPDLEAAMFRCCTARPKLPGKTILVVDVSGSMYGKTISAKSELNRAQVACSLAVLVRELCERQAIYATAGDDRREIHATACVPPRRGMALADAIYAMTAPLGGGGIFMTQCMEAIQAAEKDADRTIVITDEQDCERTNRSRAPSNAVPLGRGYIVNVGTYKNGVGYGRWTKVDGWSDAVLDYIAASEGLSAPAAVQDVEDAG